MELSEICVTVGVEKCEDRTSASDIDTVSPIFRVCTCLIIRFCPSQYVCNPQLPDGATEAAVVVKGVLCIGILFNFVV